MDPDVGIRFRDLGLGTWIYLPWLGFQMLQDPALGIQAQGSKLGIHPNGGAL